MAPRTPPFRSITAAVCSPRRRSRKSGTRSRAPGTASSTVTAGCATMAACSDSDACVFPRSPVSFLVAAVQLQSTSNEAHNLDTAAALIERAASYGAQLAATPENTNFLGPHDDKVRGAQPLDGPVCSRFAELARKHSMYVLLGSFNERNEQAAEQAAVGADGAA